MSTLAVAPTLLDRVGGEPTLDDLIAGVWEGLAAHQTAECPVCRGEMDPEYSPDARAIGGRCGVCGTTLR